MNKVKLVVHYTEQTSGVVVDTKLKPCGTPETILAYKSVVCLRCNDQCHSTLNSVINIVCTKCNVVYTITLACFASPSNINLSMTENSIT